MLIRISLFVAILAALGAGALSFTQVRGKINTLMQQRDGYHNERDQVQGQLDTTKKTLAQTQDTLKQTEQDLTTAKSDRDKAVATAATQTKRADDLSDKLTKAAADRDEAQANLAAYTQSGLTAKDVADLSRTLKNAQGTIDAINAEKVVMNRTIDRLKNQIAELIGTNYVVTLPAGLRGRILVVDPKWDFVVLNIGDDQGVKDNGELLVSRDGRLVAKVIVRSIQKDRCIANIVPGWKLGQVIEGDEVSPAHPAS
jgi:F0F1-type ATP synthase membrane subunit b/b'